MTTVGTKCEYVLGESTPQGPPFYNGRPGPLTEGDRMQWLCAWNAQARSQDDGTLRCGTHRKIGDDPL